MFGERMGELVEEVEQEKALKDIADATALDKGKAAKIAEKKTQSSEKARMLAKKRSAKVETKLGKLSLS